MEPEQRRREPERAKAQDLAMLAHELRNPLAALDNAAELLVQLGLRDPSLERIGGIVKRQTAVMRALVEQLLDIGRIDSERLELAKRTVDLRDVVRNAIEDYGPQIERAGLHREIVVPPHAVWVTGDSLKLSQVLGNLLSNAVKFTPPPGIVHVELGVSGSSACLSVRDTGVGIRPDLVPVIFERFRQERRGSHGGLGLGLPIAKQLIERHGGAIEVASDGPGRGCCVRVRLPLAQQAN